MSKLIAAVSVSLDGFVAGPDPSLNDPLGTGGMQLHEWLFAAETNVDSELIDGRRARVGAGILGRRMFSGGSGPWEQDPNARGWWGDESPFHHPVFVLTRHAREPLEMEGGTYFFVTDGPESALEQARVAAGGKDVQVHGGGSTVSQYLAAGLLDQLTVSVVGVLLGTGTRLLQDVPAGALRRTRVVESPTGVTHLEYMVLR